MVYTKAALARLARDVREEIGLTDGVAFDPFLWAREYGIPFISLQELESAADAVEHFLTDGPGRWSAALVKNGSGHLVVYNSAHVEVRVRSDLAHEIAHLVAEHALDAGWMADEGCSSGSKPQEKEASELAGALLIPAEVAKVHAIRGGRPEALARRYEVSLEMAIWRMRLSGGETIARRAKQRRASRSA